MCVHGYFHKIGASSPEYPFVDAKLIIGDRYLGKVAFLIDTGAGATLIVYKDALRLGISTKTRGKKIKIVGISGSEYAIALQEPVILELLDYSTKTNNSGGILSISLDSLQIESSTYTRKLMRKESQSSLMTRPSLLGWDALRNLKIVIDYKNKLIILCKD